MEEFVKFGIGILILIAGFPIGIFLAKLTKEELKSGQIWFKSIVLICFIGAVLSLFLKNDTFLFSFLFIGIVTGQSLIKKSKKAL